MLALVSGHVTILERSTMRSSNVKCEAFLYAQHHLAPGARSGPKGWHARSTTVHSLCLAHFVFAWKLCLFLLIFSDHLHILLQAAVAGCEILVVAVRRLLDGCLQCWTCTN